MGCNVLYVLSKWGCSIFGLVSGRAGGWWAKGIRKVISKSETMDSKSYSQHDEDFLSDGIIHLSMAQVGEIDIQRRIRCVKMRSTNHNTGFFTLLFKDGEFYATRTIVD